MELERAIITRSRDADDVASGLQIFLDNVRLRDSGIRESMQELVSLSRGLGQLRADALQFKRLPTPLEQDIRLLLQGLEAITERVHQMFGETRTKKLNGRVPYTHIWSDFCSTLQRSGDGSLLLPRLELMSIFLTTIIDGIRLGVADERRLDRLREKVTQLLHEQLNANGPGYPTKSSPVSPPSHIPMSSMPGVFPVATPWGHPDSKIPFQQAGESSRRPYNPAASPPSSHSSWQSPASSHTGGSGSSNGNAHWASLVFNGRHGSTPFPRRMATRCLVFANPMPSAFLRLEEDKFELVSKLYFEADGLEIRFYRRKKDGRARLVALYWDPATGRTAASFCIPVTALKLIRNKSTLDLFRLDRETGEYQRWASLNFVDYERLVLFYSTFAALKHQDEVTPIDGLHVDWFDTDKQPEVERFGGQIIYPPTLRHALRVFQDRYTGAVRLEARPLLGAKQHVPLWTAFITHNLREPGWLKRPADKQVELRKLEHHIFFDGYIPTISRNGRYIIKFVEKEDCDVFVSAMRDLARELVA